MDNHQVFVELVIVGVLSSCFKVLNQFLKHFSQNLHFNLIDGSKDLNCDCLVNGEHLGNGGNTEASEYSGSFLELTLLKVSLRESHQIGVEEIRALLFSESKTFFPSTLLYEDFETRHVTTSNNLVNLVVCQVHLLLFLVNLLNPHFLHFSRANLTSTLEGSVVFFTAEVSFNSFVEESNILVEISSRFILLDVQET